VAFCDLLGSLVLQLSAILLGTADLGSGLFSPYALEVMLKIRSMCGESVNVLQAAYSEVFVLFDTTVDTERTQCQESVLLDNISRAAYREQGDMFRNSLIMELMEESRMLMSKIFYGFSNAYAELCSEHQVGGEYEQ